jgi:hypothetical protein
LETPVREVALMAQVVEEVMIKAEEDGEDEMAEHLNWAVMHLCDMAKKLRPLYRSRGENEDDEKGDAS